MPTLNLEFLGNFLAELTLVVYSFLQYLPSLIAASAVFLAKLTLDPTVHPWVSMNIFIFFITFLSCLRTFPCYIRMVSELKSLYCCGAGFYLAALHWIQSIWAERVCDSSPWAPVQHKKVHSSCNSREILSAQGKFALYFLRNAWLSLEFPFKEWLFWYWLLFCSSNAYPSFCLQLFCLLSTSVISSWIPSLAGQSHDT